MTKPADLDIHTFLEKPDVERQLIVVNSDEAVKASRKAELEARGEEKKGATWQKVGEIAIKMLAEPYSLIINEAIKAWSRARTSGVNVVHVSASEAKNLDFPPGHPRYGILYIGHPAKAGVYYTMAEFHRVTFEHKFAEALKLLMHLGATKIRVEHVKGWSKDFSSRLTVPVGQSGESVGAKAGSKSSAKSKLLFEASLPGASEPSIPKELVWYPHEPIWQSITSGRLDFGLLDFSLSVTYEDDFGINSELKIAIQKSGLEIGGHFESHQSTVWRLEGEFRPQETTSA